MSRIRDQLAKVFQGAMSEPDDLHATLHTNGNAAPPEQKSVVLSLSPGIQFHSPDGKVIHRFAGTSSDSEQVSRETAYAASVYCFAAVRYRAKKLAEAPLMVVREDKIDGSKEWLPDHFLADLLEEPALDYDMGELLFRTQCYQDITGSALWVKSLDRGGRVGRLTPYAGSEFQVEQTDERIRGRFRVSTANGDEEFPPERVIYFHEPNPYDWHRGLSLVDVALSWLNLSSRARATVGDLLRNALFPSVVIQTDKEWRPTKDSPEWQLFQDQIKAHARRDKKGDPLVLTGGGSATVVTPTMKDMIPGDILNRVESVVSSVFNIPAIVLQFEVGMQNSPWSQMEEARRMVEQDTIQPLRRDVEKKLTKQLLLARADTGRQPLETDRMRLVRFDTSEVRALQPDLQLLSEVQERQADIASINERRAIVGLEPSDDPEHDKIPTKAPNPFDAFGNPAAGPERETESEEEEAAKSIYVNPATPAASVWWMEFDLTTKAAARTWEPEVARLLVRQSTDIQKLFRQFVRASGAELSEESLVRFLGEVGDYLTKQGSEIARSVLSPLVRATTETAARRVTAKLGIGWDVVQEGIARYAAEEAEFLVSVMGESTGKAVAETVQRSIEDRVPMRDLRSRLEELPAFDRKRAQLVARTETTRATNGAQRRTLIEYEVATGQRTQKTWISSRDARVRDEHDALDDGHWYPVGHVFDNGRLEPGEPNCRCVLGYRIHPEDG